MRVIRAAVLEALARAAEAGEGDEGAVRRLRVDPVLAGAARRRLRAAVLEALIQAPVSDGAELCQRAYLVLAGQPAFSHEAGEPLAARFLAARAAAGPAPRVSYLATVAVAVAGLALAGLLGLALWRAAYPGPKDAWHRRSPTPSGAYASGGAPAQVTPAVATLFQRHLVAFLLRLDRLSATAASGNPDGLAVVDAQVGLAASEVEVQCATALAEPVCARLIEVMSAARVVAGQGGDAAEHSFLDAVGRLDDQLAAAGLAVYVDGDVISTGESGRRYVILYSYAVDAVHLYQSGEHRVRALWLRRLDRLNFEQAAAGFVRPNLREALVLLDQTEDELVHLILPALAAGGVVLLSGREDAQYPGRAALEQLAGETLRREWSAALGPEAAGAARLGERLVRREAILDGVSESLRARGLVFARPTGLRMPDGWFDDLAQAVLRDTLDQLKDLDVELCSEAAAASFSAARALLAATIEIHEVEHRLDYAVHGRRMPAELEAIVGPVLFEGRERGGAAAARDEMSAYLAQLARTPSLVGTNLVLMSRFLQNRDFWGGAECHAALVIFSGLARELSLPDEKLIVQHFVDRAAAARTLSALLARPPAQVAAAAARLWAHLYGEPLAQGVSGAGGR